MYRIWGQWWIGYRGVAKGTGLETPNIVFVTASATLKSQVSKAFRKLQVWGGAWVEVYRRCSECTGGNSCLVWHREFVTAHDFLMGANAMGA